MFLVQFNTKKFITLLKLKPILVCILAFFLFSCAADYQAPVSEVGSGSYNSRRVSSVSASTSQSEVLHQVKSGETLYSIAFQYNLEYSALAKANNVPAPYVIFPGQTLNLNVSINRSAQNNNAVATTSVNRTAATPQPTIVQPRTPVNTNLRWQWPASGRLLAEFSNDSNENKGIDIDGQEGDTVVAAEAGEVVYAGSGLLRYGDLLIIKHNSRFLSAYAHNSKLLVSEGDVVKSGQVIAELGSTGIDKNMLHFEIRNNGTPVNPLSFLPSR